MSTAIVMRAVQEITACKYFPSRDDGYCVGALQSAAKSLGRRLLDDQAKTLIPELRTALTACAEVKP